MAHIIRSGSAQILFSYEKSFVLTSSSNSDEQMENLKSIFRKFAKIIHPDKCKSTYANEAFVKLKDAYDEISQKILIVPNILR